MANTPVVIVGAGSLGQSFAGLLAHSGCPVTLLATAGSAERLHTAGRIALRGVVELFAPVSHTPPQPGQVAITTQAADLPLGAWVLFMTKGPQLAQALAAVRATAGNRVACVSGVQNGVLQDDLLAGAFGRERVVGLVTILAAQRETAGGVLIPSLGATYVGEFDGRSSERVRWAAEVFQRAGIPTEAVASIASARWSKACHAAAGFGVSVLTGAGFARLFSDPDLVRAYLALLREAAAIAATVGVQIQDYTPFPVRTYVEQPDEQTIERLCARSLPPGTPANPLSLPSMTQDLLAGRPLEVDEVFGDLVQRAEQLGVAVPRLMLVRDLIRGLDPGRHATSAAPRSHPDPRSSGVAPAAPSFQHST